MVLLYSQTELGKEREESESLVYDRSKLSAELSKVRHFFEFNGSQREKNALKTKTLNTRADTKSKIF